MSHSMYWFTRGGTLVILTVHVYNINTSTGDYITEYCYLRHWMARYGKKGCSTMV